MALTYSATWVLVILLVVAAIFVGFSSYAIVQDRKYLRRARE
jgi:hypothetical protein